MVEPTEVVSLLQVVKRYLGGWHEGDISLLNQPVQGSGNNLQHGRGKHAVR